MAAAIRNGVIPFTTVTSGRRYSTSSVSNPASDACFVPDLPTIDSMRMRRKKISATATPAMAPSHSARNQHRGMMNADIKAQADEQQHGHHRVAGEVV